MHRVVLTKSDKWEPIIQLEASYLIKKKGLGMNIRRKLILMRTKGEIRMQFFGKHKNVTDALKYS